MTDSVATMQQRLGVVADGQLGPVTLSALMGVASGNGAPSLAAASALITALRKYGLTDPPRIVNMLANCGAESGFRLVAENLNYSAARLMQVWPNRFPTMASTVGYANSPEALANKVYGGRMGNDQPGDGWRFRGRSWPQLTGREAYAAVARITGLDLLTDPDLILTFLGAAEGACGFWQWKGLSVLADAGRAQDLRIRWNGGTNGLTATLAAVARLEALWGITS